MAGDIRRHDAHCDVIVMAYEYTVFTDTLDFYDNHITTKLYHIYGNINLRSFPGASQGYT